VRVSQERTLEGRIFQIAGAANRKPRAPNEMLQRVTERRLAEADRRVMHGVCHSTEPNESYYGQRKTKRITTVTEKTRVARRHAGNTLHVTRCRAKCSEAGVHVLRRRCRTRQW